MSRLSYCGLSAEDYAKGEELLGKKHERGVFGYDLLVEQAFFRDQLKDENLSDTEMVFALSRKREELYKDKPSYKERQKVWLEEQRAKHTPNKDEQLSLTEEEMEYLVEQLTGVNYPVGQDILAKLVAHLAETQS